MQTLVPSRIALRQIVITAVLALVALVTLTATTTAQQATGRVRVMHASPDVPPVDIFVDGQKAVTALAFPKDTGYVTLPAGAHNVKVFVSPSNGTGTPALEANLTIGAGKDYTVLAVGQLANSTLALLPLEDQNALPGAGISYVRLIHASPDAPAVDVTPAGSTTKLFSNVAFKSVGNYTSVPAGTYNLDVKAAGTTTVAKSVAGLTLAPQTVYSVVAVGLLGNGSLQVIPLRDAGPAPATPGAPTTGSGLATDAGDEWLRLVVIGLLVGGAGVAALTVGRRRIDW